FQTLEDRVHCRFCLGARQTRALDYVVNDVLLDQWSLLARRELGLTFVRPKAFLRICPKASALKLRFDREIAILQVLVRCSGSRKQCLTSPIVQILRPLGNKGMMISWIFSGPGNSRRQGAHEP